MSVRGNALGKHKPRCDFVVGTNAYRRRMRCTVRATVRVDVDACAALPELEGMTFRCAEHAGELVELLTSHGAQFHVREVPS